MDSKLIEETFFGLAVIYKATMELYENYFKTLEAALKATPDSEIEKLKKLNDLIQEANEAMEYDLGVFEKALSSDMEDMMKMEDELKIQAIYKNLNQNLSQ